jgi:hypothetical protein
LGVSVRPEYFLFLDGSVLGSTAFKVAACVTPCMIGVVVDMEPVFGSSSSSSSESVDMETSDAESSLWITEVSSMAGVIWVSPMLGWACVGDESAEVESAGDDSSEDVSLSGDSIVKGMRATAASLRDAEVEPSAQLGK